VISSPDEQSDYATVRMDKPGVGESQGHLVARPIFRESLKAIQAAFDSMSKYDFLDLDRIFVMGLSNGAVLPRGFAPKAPVCVAYRRRLLGTHMVRAYAGNGTPSLEPMRASPPPT